MAEPEIISQNRFIILEQNLLQNPHTVQQEIFQLQQTVDETQHPYEAARLLSLTASALHIQGRCDEAIETAGKALVLFSRMKEPQEDAGRWILRTKMTIGVCRISRCEYAQGIYQFLEVKDRAVRLGDTYHFTDACISLGEVYTDLGMNDQAMTFLETAVKALEKHHDELQAASVSLQLGKLLGIQKNFQQALEHLGRALEVFEKFSSVQTPELLLTMGEIYLMQQDTLRSGQFLSTALELSKTAGTPSTEVRALHLTAKLDLEQGQNAQAEKHLNQSLDLARRHNLKKLEIEISECLMQLHAEKGNYQQISDVSFTTARENRELYLKSILSDVKSMELAYELKKSRQEIQSVQQKHVSGDHAMRLTDSVSRLSRDINCLKDLYSVIHSIWNSLSDTIPLDSLSILPYHAENNELSREYRIESRRRSRISNPMSCTSESSLEAYCARNRTCMVISNVAEEGYRYRKGPVSDAENMYLSWMLLPLIVGDRLMGVMTLQSIPNNSYSKGDLTALSLLANQTAALMHSFSAEAEVKRAKDQLTDEQQRISQITRELKDAHSKIEQMAIYDDITGLPNRHLLYERAVPSLHLAKRNKTPYAVCSIDIDNFKQINDMLGHWAGDEALRIIARRLSKNLRKSDLVARLGGDEFAAVFSDLKQKNAIEVVLKKVLNELQKPLEIGRETFSISASIGVSFYPDDASDFTQLLSLADKAQYIAKHQGKNRYCLYSEAEKSRKLPRNTEIS